MTFIAMNLGDAKEPEVVPDGDYELRVFAWEEKEGDSDKRGMILVSMEILDPPKDVPNPAPVFFNILFQKDGDEEKTTSFILLNNARFLTALGVPFEDGGFDPDDLQGASGTLPLTVGEYNGEPKNEIKPPRMG